jgi:hypothetical protein
VHSITDCEGDADPETDISRRLIARHGKRRGSRPGSGKAALRRLMAFRRDTAVPIEIGLLSKPLKLVSRIVQASKQFLQS